LAKQAIKLCNKDITLLELRGYSRDEVADLMNAVDLCLLTSFSEGSPNVIKEAMACARPPIVANIGGGPEAISHMETGLLFEPGNTKDLVKALKSLIEDPLLRKRLGGKALLTARERFDAEKCAKRILGLFKQLLTEKSYAKKGN